MPEKLANKGVFDNCGARPVDLTILQYDFMLRAPTGAGVGLLISTSSVLAGTVRGAQCGREITYSLVDEDLAHIVGDAVTHAWEAEP